MNRKSVECPSCIGAGEVLKHGKYLKQCRYCEGTGVVDIEIANAFLHEKLYDEEI